MLTRVLSSKLTRVSVATTLTHSTEAEEEALPTFSVTAGLHGEGSAWGVREGREGKEGRKGGGEREGRGEGGRRRVERGRGEGGVH